MQLTLALFGRARLRPAVEDYLATQCDDLADGTKADYLERANWLYKAFGEWSPLERITYAELNKVVREWGPSGAGLRNVTLKKRFTFLRAVMTHAHEMGDGPAVPKSPKLRDDSSRPSEVHTLEQFCAFRLYLPEGPFRRMADLAFWCGYHRLDLFQARRWWLEPDHEWSQEVPGSDVRGRFWRHNNKSKRKVPPAWFPIEPGARPFLKAILEEIGPARDGLICGRVWNISKTWYKAADKAGVPRVSPTRLRSSYATRLRESDYSTHFVQMGLGHVGEYGDDGRAMRSSVATRNYIKMSAGIVRSMPTTDPMSPKFYQQS